MRKREHAPGERWAKRWRRRGGARWCTPVIRSRRRPETEKTEPGRAEVRHAPFLRCFFFTVFCVRFLSAFQLMVVLQEKRGSGP